MKEKYLKFISIFGLIIIIFLFISNCIKINFVQDDAYTTFRYVRNFVEGNGLVFNYGERVEGYTSFLFVMLLSASFKIGLIIENSAQLLSILFCVFALIITYKLSNLFVNNSISSSNNRDGKDQEGDSPK